MIYNVKILYRVYREKWLRKMSKLSGNKGHHMVDFSVAVNNDQNQIAVLGDIRISTRKADPTYRAYLGREWYEEAVSPFYSHVERDISPKVILDIGGNHGVAAVIAGMAMANAKVICVEPIPELAPYIKYNLHSNGIKSYDVITGIAGEVVAEGKKFHLNPNGSGDSRVIPHNDTWKPITVIETTIDHLLKDVSVADGLYMKLDTQGYEPLIMKGGEHALSARKKWLMKSEFAPNWMRNQNLDPVEFLSYLLARYDVTEFPAQYAFNMDYRDLIRDKKLKLHEAEAFVNYVANQFRNDLGWVDVLISPKS